jgi:hypothetical protein
LRRALLHFPATDGTVERVVKKAIPATRCSNNKLTVLSIPNIIMYVC